MLKKRQDDTLLALPMKSGRKGVTMLSPLMCCVVECYSSSSTWNRKLLDLASICQMKVALREGLVSVYAFSLFGRVLGSHRYAADECRFGNLSIQRMDVSNPSDHVPTLTTTTVFLSHLHTVAEVHRPSSGSPYNWCQLRRRNSLWISVCGRSCHLCQPSFA